MYVIWLVSVTDTEVSEEEVKLVQDLIKHVKTQQQNFVHEEKVCCLVWSVKGNNQPLAKVHDSHLIALNKNTYFVIGKAFG